MPNKTYYGSGGSKLEGKIHHTPLQPGPWFLVGSNATSWQDTATFGSNLPNWKQRIASGLSATTSFSGTKRSLESAPGELFGERLEVSSGRRRSVRYLGNMGYNLAIPSASGLSLTQANNAALAQFVTRANQIMSSFQGGTFIGELGETLRMIRSPLKALRRNVELFIPVSRDRVRKVGRRSKRRVASETWLEYSYGWKPLIHDIREGAEALAGLTTHRPPSKRVSGVSVFSTKPSRQVFTDTMEYWKRTVRRETNEYASVRYHGAFSCAPPTISGALHLTWRDVLPTAYELIPYSFLVDYFTNFGSIVSSTAFNKSLMQWCEKGTMMKSESSLDVSFEYINAPAGWTTLSHSEHCGGRSTASHEVKTRSAYSGTFIPSLEFRIPGLGTKWINMAALAITHREAARVAFRR